MDRTKLSVVSLKDASDIQYWSERSPSERLRAIQIYRETAYGYANASGRLQRVLEIAKRV